MSIKIFIISLKNSSRRQFQKKQFASLNLNFEFFDAISKIDVEENKLFKFLNFDWERPLNVSEKACYLSHKSLWEEVIKTNTNALILEDDALVSKNLPIFLKKIERKFNFDYINLENRGRKKILSKSKIFITEDFSLRKLLHDSTGAAGYLLSPSGARKILLCESKKGRALADAQIANCSQLNKYQMIPPLVIQLDMCQYYSIKTPKWLGDIANSSVSFKDKPPTKAAFKFRRIKSQIKIGVKKVFYSILGENKEVGLANKDSFIFD